MKKTIEEATAMIKETFGADTGFPMIAIGEALACNEEYDIQYSKQEEKIYVYDISTVWEIDMTSGSIDHCGIGNGCFWVHYGNLREEEEEM